VRQAQGGELMISVDNCFFEYIRILREKKPLFFLAENVSGILLPRHKNAFENILHEFALLGYQVSYFLLNAHDFDIPQDRKRVIIVGYRNDMKKKVFSTIYCYAKACFKRRYF
jgi:DNA-cytosine methyltransferase